LEKPDARMRMMLNILSLALLILILVVVFYGVIAVHDIPHRIAKARNHPHQDAIGAAGWISLLMLGSLWPFLWIWAMAYRPERGWGFENDLRQSMTAMERRLAAVEERTGDER
jgi:hypothetical protein